MPSPKIRVIRVSNFQSPFDSPFVDALLDPIDLTTAPFVDPDAAGLGFPIGLAAPGEGLIVLPVKVDAFASAGEPWAGGDANEVLHVDFWHTSPVDATASGEGSQFGFEDNALTDTAAENPFFSPRRSWPLLNATGFTAVAAALIANAPSTVVNAPLVITGNGDLLAGVGVGARSLRLRIYYEIIPVVPFANLFFRVTAVNQGTKTFTVADPYEQVVVALGTTFTVVGSTGNNGTYTKVSATFVTDHTNIVVSQSIPSATANGWVKIAT